MRKKFWLLLCFILLAGTCAAVSACAAEKDHAHVYSQEWTCDGTRHWHACTYEGCESRQDVEEHDLQTVQQIEDCTKGGTRKSECSVCGYSQVTEVAPQEHVLIQHEREYPTCTKAGHAAYESCTQCNYTTFRVISPLGHELKDNTCLRCNKSLHKNRDAAYGYNFLGTLANGEDLQQFYARIDDEVRALHASGEDVAAQDGAYPFAVVNYASFGLTVDEVASVWKTYKNDNPLYYWFSNTMNVKGDTAELLVYEEYALAADRAYYNTLIDRKVTEFAQECGERDAYGTALFLHDTIIDSVDYVSGDYRAWAHNVVGVFEGRGAVCEGYARTFQLLLDWFDVENVLATGMSSGEEHAWNLAKMDDGQWYWFDLTYDDTPRFFLGRKYDYFCATDGDVSADHTPDTSSGAGVDFLYDLPERAQQPYADGVLGETIADGENTYSVIGDGELSLVSIGQSGEVVIPDEISFAGRDYRVVSVGEDEIGSVVQENIQVTAVDLPATVCFIWDRALSIPSVERYAVAEGSAQLCAEDGVLFSRNKMTLIAFPGANSMEDYAIPDETAYIAFGAFDTVQHLHHITFGENVVVFGIANWGNGYPDPASRNGTRFYNIISHEMENLFDKLIGEKKLTVSDRNKHFILDDIALYKGDEEGLQLEYIFDRSITTFHFSERVRWLTENGWYIFNECKNLQSFTVDEDNPWLCERDGVVYTKDLKRIICAPRAIRGSITVPEGVTDLDGWIFRDCALLERVTLPSTLTSIKEYAFCFCSSLTAVNVPEGVTEIGKWAFAGCSALTDISLPDGIAKIGEYAFWRTGLDGITLPAGLEEIGEAAFGYSSIRYAYIPGSVRLIGYSAFGYCEQLTNVFFQQPADWQLEKKYFNVGESTGETVFVSAEALVRPDLAAATLKETYIFYIWRRADGG